MRSAAAALGTGLLGATAAGPALARTVTTGAGTPRTGTARTVGRQVVVVGDSITVESSQLMTSLLRLDGYAAVRVEAERFRRMTVSGDGVESGDRVLRRLRDEGVDPDAWIIALGTNDIGSYSGQDAFGLQIDQLLELVPRTAPLVWVDTYLPDRLELCADMNAALVHRIMARGDARIAPWSAACTAAAAGGDDLLRSDRIHPDARGRTVFAVLLTTALRRQVLGGA